MAKYTNKSNKTKVRCKICNKHVTYLLKHIARKPKCEEKYTKKEIEQFKQESEKREQAYQTDYNAYRQKNYNPVKKSINSKIVTDAKELREEYINKLASKAKTIEILNSMLTSVKNASVPNARNYISCMKLQIENLQKSQQTALEEIEQSEDSYFIKAKGENIISFTEDITHSLFKMYINIMNYQHTKSKVTCQTQTDTFENLTQNHERNDNKMDKECKNTATQTTTLETLLHENEFQITDVKGQRNSRNIIKNPLKSGKSQQKTCNKMSTQTSTNLGVPLKQKGDFIDLTRKRPNSVNDKDINNVNWTRYRKELKERRAKIEKLWNSRENHKIKKPIQNMNGQNIYCSGS